MRMREIRKAQKISIATLSEMTGIHRRTLQDMEYRDDCLVSNAIKVADALGVSMDELCIGSEIKEAE